LLAPGSPKQVNKPPSLAHKLCLIQVLAYNKWHETELERWLSDHDIPYPKAADRKDLENLVKSNWDSKIQQPIAKSTDSASDSLASVKDWIFDRSEPAQELVVVMCDS
jgi:hypothetical protein